MATQASADVDAQPYIHHLVWLDKNIDTDCYRRKLDQLREFDEKIQTFTSRERCLDYLREHDERNAKTYIILIVSDSLSEKVVPKVLNCECILAILVFSTQSEQVGPFESDMVTICTNIEELIHRIRGCINADQSSIDYSLLKVQDTNTTNEEQQPIRNLKEDQARFVWFYKCHSFMIELEDDDEQAKKEMIALCRENSVDDKRDTKAINEFEDESLKKNAQNAICWYTQNSIIARSINEALVSGKIERIYSYRYLIRLICRQLKRLYKKDRKSYTKNNLRLYRGVALKLPEILQTSRNKNVLISLNGFISTSLNEGIAKRFCSNRKKVGHKPVLFEIDIDMTTEHSIAFADIEEFSRFPGEEEILLSIGTVFRIESVRFDEVEGLYRIHLSLCQHDQLTVNEFIEQTFPNECHPDELSILFGKLLFDMGEYEFALKYFQNRIDCLSNADNHHRPTYLNNIGVCYNEIGNSKEALKYYRNALKIYEQSNNHRGLGACYHNMANCYYEQRDNDSALKYALKALDERREYPLEKAATLDLLGSIELAKHDTEAARDHTRQALEIRLRHWRHINPSHPDIGISYRNLGKLDSKSSAYADAERNYQQAHQILSSNYPDTHSLMMGITAQLRNIGRKLGN